MRPLRKDKFVNKKLTNLKSRVKDGIKEYAPEIVTAGVSAIAIVTYVYCIVKLNNVEDDTVEILDGGDEGYVVLSAEAFRKMTESVTKILFKDKAGNYYSLSSNE